MDTLGKKDVAQMITELDKNGVDAEAMDMLPNIGVRPCVQLRVYSPVGGSPIK